MNIKYALFSTVFLFVCFLRPCVANPVTLGIYDSTGTQSVVDLTAGQTFDAQVIVSGLTSPELDSFDLTFDLPSDLTLKDVTATTPTGWIQLSSGNPSGAANFSGSDITGTSELVLASFQVADTAAPGSEVLSFAPPYAFQDLTASDGVTTIPYTERDLTLNVTAAPEPSTLGLSFVALIAFCLCIRMKRRHRSPFKV